MDSSAQSRIAAAGLAPECSASAGGGESVARTMVWFALLLAVAAVPRFSHLHRSFWLDETYSALIARLSGHDFWTVVTRQPSNMMLYYLWLRLWSRLGGGEFALRSLSVLAGLAALPAIYALGKKLFDARTARMAALLLAVNAFHIFYSQEARAYSLMMTLAILSCWFFIRGLEKPTSGNWLLYALISVAAIGTQVFAGWVVLAQWMSLLWRERPQVPWKKLLLSGAAIAVPSALLAWRLMLVSERPPLFWLQPPRLRDVYTLFVQLTGQGAALLLPLCALLVLLAAGSARARRSQQANEYWRSAFLLNWLRLPLLIVFVISLKAPMFSPRYFIECLPALLLLIARGISRLRPAPLAAAVLYLVVALFLHSSLGYLNYRNDPGNAQDWRAATGYVLSQARPGDAVVFFFPIERIPFDYYRARLDAPGRELQLLPDIGDVTLLSRGQPEVADAVLSQAAGRYQRVWAIWWLHSRLGTPHRLAFLLQSYGQQDNRDFGLVHTRLFHR